MHSASKPVMRDTSKHNTHGCVYTHHAPHVYLYLRDATIPNTCDESTPFVRDMSILYTLRAPCVYTLHAPCVMQPCMCSVSVPCMSSASVLHELCVYTLHAALQVCALCPRPSGALRLHSPWVMRLHHHARCVDALLAALLLYIEAVLTDSKFELLRWC